MLTGPEEDKVLFFQRGHFLYNGPEPAFEGHQSVGTLATLVVERCVTDQRRHVDVANLKDSNSDVTAHYHQGRGDEKVHNLSIDGIARNSALQSG